MTPPGAAAAAAQAAAAAPPWTWYFLPRAHDSGGNQVTLLRGGAELFPAMAAAIATARDEVWLATYIFHTDASSLALVSSLCEAARRGVRVHVVVDGFGSLHSARVLRELFEPAGVRLAVFRPLRRLAHWFNPGQLRRQHMKLCVVDAATAFVGGINVIDDHIDLRHGHSEQPRLDYAAQVRGPAAAAVCQAVRAVWSRAYIGRQWRREVTRLLQRGASDAAPPSAGGPGVAGGQPPVDPLAADRPPADPPPARGRLRWLRQQMRQLQVVLGRPHRGAAASAALVPVHTCFIVRDNLRQRRSIERTYVDAIRAARRRILIVCPYFYPGGEFRRALCDAARRGVQVQLLLQGKLDYRLAGLAAHALYDELLRAGVAIFEYTPAFLHAKVAVVDEAWATVGSSNIDPLSLLLNLEANLVVHDAGFCAHLAGQLQLDLAVSRRVDEPAAHHQGWRGWAGLVRRGLVAWVAHVYLRVAGVTGRY
ncbi:MAG: cardiolipin synthase ClsB [Pseudomonadota bacterium]